MLSLLASSLKLRVLPIFIIISLLRLENALETKCMNNGTLAVHDNKFECVCPYPFSGRLCEDFACVNGLSTGLQYNPISTFFNKRCLCDSGWTGELCDKSLINRCGSKGEEIKGKCVCQNNFVGDRCQYVTQCLHGQLYNGRCSCHYGWAGDFCDNIICHQGEPDESNRKCICPPKYRGRYCDFCAQPSSSPPPECLELEGGNKIIHIDGDNVPIIMAVVIATVLVVLGAVFYLLCYKLKKTKELKNARQTPRDIEDLSSENICETCPLHGSNIHNRMELTEDSEKFFDAPPPYETVALERKQTETAPEQTDSGFNSASSSAETYVPENCVETSNSNLISNEQLTNQNTAMAINQKVSLSDEVTKTAEAIIEDFQGFEKKGEKLHDNGMVTQTDLGLTDLENCAKEIVRPLSAAGEKLIANDEKAELNRNLETVREKDVKQTSENRTMEVINANNLEADISHRNSIIAHAQLEGSHKPGLIVHGILKLPEEELNSSKDEEISKKNAADALALAKYEKKRLGIDGSHRESDSRVPGDTCGNFPIAQTNMCKST